MKTNKVLKRILTVLLSTAVFICSTPAMASAMELEAEDTLSADVIIEETVSENSIVEEASSLDDGTILEDTISVNSVSGDVIQPDADESLLDESNEIVTPDGALKPGDAIFVEYDLSSYSGQIGYSTVPSGYTTYSDDVYTSNSAIVETAKGATVTLLPPPDILPANKQFIGWDTAFDGAWIENSRIPLSDLARSIEYEYDQKCCFYCYFAKYMVNYDLDGGSIWNFEHSFLAKDMKNPSLFRDGLDSTTSGADCLLAEEWIIPPAGAEFLGWSVDGVNIIEDLNWYDWAANGNKVYLKAIYSNSTPQPITHTLTLSGLTGIDQDSLSALQAQGFTIKGDTATKTFTNTDSKFYLPALNKPGHSFLGWYETGKSPSTASLYVEFDPATSYDISYTASFQEDVSISLRSSLTLYEGQSISLSATVRPENVVQTVTWTNSDSEVASLTGSMVKARKAGTCKITATSVADPSKTAVCKVTVLKSEVTETDEYGNPIDPGSYAMDENGQMNIWIAGLDKDGYHYTGYAIKPEIHVYNGKELLREGVDYTLSYKNNTKVSTKVTKASSKPQISIKMKGQYAGSETAYFEIVPTSVEDLEAKDAKINVSYDKKKHQVKPTLTYQGKDLKAGNSDLVFKWFEADASGNATDTESACIDPGLYAVKVYAGSSGNFTSNTAGYQIATITVQGDHGKIPMSNVKLNNFKTKMTYNGGVAVEQADATLSCKLGKTTKTLVLGEDYTVSYKNNYDIGTATAIYEATESGEFVGKITKDFSITGKYTLDDSAGGNAIVTLEDDSFEFTNAAIKPDVTVQAKMVNNDGVEEVRTLVQGKDYTVSYKNNKSVADATVAKAPQVIVKGKGSYAFKQSGAIKHFSITKPELSSQVVTIPDKPYNKKPNAYKSVKILITDRNYNNLKLKAGKDYTVEYVTPGGTDTPVAGQTVEVVITATETSSYTGSVTGSYRITEPKDGDITKAKAIVNPDSKGKTKPCAYTGDAIEPGQTDQPGLILTSGSGKKLKTLTEGVDYEIIGYYNNILPSKKAIILVRGIGEYKGIKAFKFTITARPVSSHWGGVFGW